MSISPLPPKSQYLCHSKEHNMKTHLLPLRIPECLLCRTSVQMSGYWQLDTHTLPGNIYTASRTCLSGFRQNRKERRKKNTNKQKPQPRRKHPEEPQERELSTFPEEVTAQESLPSINLIKTSNPQLKEISEAWQCHMLDT